MKMLLSVPISFAMSWWSTQLVPIVVIVVIAVSWPFLSSIKDDRGRSKMISACLHVLSFFYFSVAANTLAVFDCQFNGVGNVMNSEPSVTCEYNDPTYAKIFLPALVFCGVYLGGVPLLFFGLLYRNRREIQRIQSSKSTSALSTSSLASSPAQKSSPSGVRDDECLVSLTFGFLFHHYKPSV